MGHNEKVVTGVLKGFKKNWNPFANQAHMQVKVGARVVEVPIDRRQIPFVEKEYGVGDMVELYYEGGWHFRSREIDLNEPTSFSLEKSVYI